MSAYEILPNGGIPISLFDTALLFRILCYIFDRVRFDTQILGHWFVEQILVNVTHSCQRKW